MQRIGAMSEAQRIRVIDSHTGGEPTRIVIEGGPDLGDGSLSVKLERLRSHHESFRSAVVNEPRGSDVLVGGLLCEPLNPANAAAVIFFNNVGYLGMCGHGTIGLVVTLAHLGRIAPGEHLIETPVGTVGTVLHSNGEVTFENVASFREAANVSVSVPGYGIVIGDIAWGGNWFFLVKDHSFELTLQNVGELTDFSWAIRCALRDQGIVGTGNHEIDHVELFSPPQAAEAHSRNFVLCPGKAYDRSPCGTGTSAKLACLYADGKLREGEIWRQESFIGSVFEGCIKVRDGKLYPRITGRAFVNAETTLLLDPRDPFCMGIRI
jgi:4-hydroxyproline epimerase